jgi:hypothetical protein
MTEASMLGHLLTSSHETLSLYVQALRSAGKSTQQLPRRTSQLSVGPEPPKASTQKVHRRISRSPGFGSSWTVFAGIGWAWAGS